MSERSRMVAGAVVGALVGTAAAYLFFTDRGRQVRSRLEPLVDDLRYEFAGVQRTFEKVGDLADQGIRAVRDFNSGRTRSPFSGGSMSH